MDIACAVTAVRERYTAVTHTVHYLAAGGFPAPVVLYDMNRNAMAHWASVFVHLWTTRPKAEAYAIFQDDIVACKGLRDTVEAGLKSFGSVAYLNCYTAPQNEKRIESRSLGEGWVDSNQLGKGALGLVFGREAALALLTAESFWKKHSAEIKHDRSIDGCVVTAMVAKGFKELVHNPSLLNHRTDIKSAIGNGRKKASASFPGEEWEGRR